MNRLLWGLSYTTLILGPKYTQKKNDVNKREKIFSHKSHPKKIKDYEMYETESCPSLPYVQKLKICIKNLNSSYSNEPYFEK